MKWLAWGTLCLLSVVGVMAALNAPEWGLMALDVLETRPMTVIGLSMVGLTVSSILVAVYCHWSFVPIGGVFVVGGCLGLVQLHQQQTQVVEGPMSLVQIATPYQPFTSEIVSVNHNSRVDYRHEELYGRAACKRVVAAHYKTAVISGMYNNQPVHLASFVDLTVNGKTANNMSCSDAVNHLNWDGRQDAPQIPTWDELTKKV